MQELRKFAWFLPEKEILCLSEQESGTNVITYAFIDAQSTYAQQTVYLNWVKIGNELLDNVFDKDFFFPNRPLDICNFLLSYSSPHMDSIEDHLDSL